MQNGRSSALTQLKALSLQLVDTEKKIRESERLYRAIVEHLDECLFRMNVNCVITFANEALCTLLKKGRESCEGTSFIQYVADSDKTKLLEHLSSTTSPDPNGSKEEIVLKLKAGGEERWTSWTFRPLYESETLILEGYQVTGRDITDVIKVKESAVYGSEFVTLLSEASVKFLQLTASELDAAVNESLMALAQMSNLDCYYVFEVMDHRAVPKWGSCLEGSLSFTEDLDICNMRKLREAIFQREVVYIYDVNSLSEESVAEKSMFIEKELRTVLIIPIFCRDRTTGFILFGGRKEPSPRLSHELGCMKLFGSLVGGIIARQKYEYSLLEKENSYKLLLSSIQDYYYRINARGQLTNVSKSIVALLGYDSEEDVLGKDVANSFYKDPSERYKMLGDLITKGRIENYPVTLKKKDGTPVPVLLTSSVVYGRDNSVRAVEGIFRTRNVEVPFKYESR